MKSCNRWVLAVLLLVFVAGFQITLLPSETSAATIEYALLTQDAHIESVSSQLLGFNQTARDNLLRPGKVAWLGNGDTGFIFDNGDSDQWIILDLGQNRNINKIGANFVAPFGDREVWDYFGVSISTTSPYSFTPVGHIGTKNNYINYYTTDITTAPLYFLLETPAEVRYIKYEFGRYSLDYNGGGSRIVDLYAQNVSPVPVPPSIWLLGSSLFGLIGIRRKFR
jgi:hypothetical protein